MIEARGIGPGAEDLDHRHLFAVYHDDGDEFGEPAQGGDVEDFQAVASFAEGGYGLPDGALKLILKLKVLPEYTRLGRLPRLPRRRRQDDRSRLRRDAPPMMLLLSVDPHALVHSEFFR
jgi:hypothetical protein